MELQVADNPDKHRYEAKADGEVAGYISYIIDHNERAFTHTEIDSRFRGHGIGGVLVQRTLDDAAARGLQVLPFCPFVRQWIGEHPDYLKLVPEDRRAEFGL